MKRTVTPELLDTDAGTPAEIAASLSDLRRINLRFGGLNTAQAMIEQVARQGNASRLSILEVAAGSGDVPQLIHRRLARQGLQIDFTLLDRARSHFTNGSRQVVADALALPFREASFDLVACGLFVHHLSPEQIVDFVNEGLRVCRTAVLINDLVRHPVHLALVYAGYPLYGSRLTRHDAPASVRQAYTPAEMRELLKQTRAARIVISRHYLFRMGVIVWKT